ncbi:MAG: anaerobic ribonucleoside-triphosphate reductase [Acidaminococcaceae bacterium]|nr:anaerobic ribonucleoside-triphosphate reductase [Acidaminococcaceae bacterium]
MTYEVEGVKVNCVDGISEQEAAGYLHNQLSVMPHKTLLSLDIDLDGEDVVLKPHYDSIVRVRRITGYLSTLPRFNDAKRSEAKERVAHL